MKFRSISLALSFAALAAVTSMQARAANPVKIMPLGDSITQGWQIGSNFYMSYRYKLYADLSAENYNFTFVGSDSSFQSAPGDPSQGTLPDGQKFHDGFSGDTIDDIKNNIDTYIAASTPDDILLHIGTNDFWTFNETAATASGKLDALVARIFQDSPNVHLYLAGIIPFFNSNADTGFVQVSLYDQTIQNTIVPKYQGLGDNITYVDMHTPFLNPDGSGNLSLYDGVHPTVAGAQLMGDIWNQALAVPEPGSLALLGFSLSAVALRRRK